MDRLGWLEKESEEKSQEWAWQEISASGRSVGGVEKGRCRQSASVLMEWLAPPVGAQAGQLVYYVRLNPGDGSYRCKLQSQKEEGTAIRFTRQPHRGGRDQERRIEEL